MKRFLLSAAIVALIPAAAAAADLPVYEPAPIVAPVPVGYDWSGFYAGLNAGYGWGDFDVDVTDATGPVPDLSDGSFSIDGDGFVGGVHLGYNAQFGWFVIGAEGMVQFSGIDGDETSTFGAEDDEFDTDLDWLALASLRAGIAVDRALIYVKGGYAGGDVELSFDDDVGPNAGSYSEGEWLHGYSIGGGLEFMATQNVIVGLEYNFIDLGDEEFSGSVSGDGDTFDADVDVKIHEVKGRVSYKF